MLKNMLFEITHKKLIRMMSTQRAQYNFGFVLHCKHLLIFGNPLLFLFCSPYVFGGNICTNQKCS